MPSIMIVESPIGPLGITVSEGALRALHLDATPGTPAAPAALEGLKGLRGDPADRAVASEVAAQLDAYFDGTLESFDVPVAPSGTAFQRAVWEQLRHIAYGTVASYGDIARRIGNPTATRAVGAANRSNPIAIIVPCHRVIGANGALTGYAGGMWRKEWLLKHEGFTGCAPTRS